MGMGAFRMPFRNKYGAKRTGGKIIHSGRYLVTKSGEVYSLIFSNRMTTKPRETPLKLKAFVDRDGYAHVALSINGRRIDKTVHALVLETFVGPRPPGFHAGHKDGNPQNNSLNNLYWITPKQNQEDRRAHGRRDVGERVKTSKLKEYQVREIFRRRTLGEKQQEIADDFGVCSHTVGQIFRGIGWKHLGLKHV